MNPLQEWAACRGFGDMHAAETSGQLSQLRHIVQRKRAILFHLVISSIKRLSTFAAIFPLTSVHMLRFQV